MLNSKFLFLSLVGISASAYKPLEQLKSLQFNRPETVLYRSIRSIELAQGRLGLKRLDCGSFASHVLQSGYVLVKCSTGEETPVEVCLETKGEHKFLNSDMELSKQEVGESFGLNDINCQVIKK